MNIVLREGDRFINSTKNVTTIVKIHSSGTKCTLLSITGAKWEDDICEIVNRIRGGVYTDYISILDRTYSIKEIEQNSSLVVYLDSIEEHQNLKKLTKRLTSVYHGRHYCNLNQLTYSNSSAETQPGSYRNATIIKVHQIQEYLKAYQNEVQETNSLIKNKLESFTVDTNKEKLAFNRYIALCEKYNIPYDKNWYGDSRYYGVKNNNHFASLSTTLSLHFSSVEEFEQFLINKNQNKNEVPRQNQTESRRQINGEPRVSKCSKQIAVGIRPIGNETSCKIRRKRIEHIALSRRARLC